MSRVPGARQLTVLAVLLLAIPLATSATSTASAATAATSLTLTSAGSDGVAADENSGMAALAAGGTQTAFTSRAVLKVGASVPQTPSESPPSDNRIYVRNRLTGATTLISDAGKDEATAPAISKTGRIVAYATDDLDDGDNEIDVVDRLATGKGRFDTQGNLVRRQVTGNPGDPHFQRIGPCAFGEESDPPGRCGPALSQDGSTLAYPAQLSPISPALNIFEFDDGDRATISGNIVDMVSPGEMEIEGGASFNEAVDLGITNESQTPIHFTGRAGVTGPFTVETNCGDTTQDLTLDTGQTCDIDLSFQGDAVCLNPNGTSSVFTGDLTTDATTPAGQSDVTVVAACASHTGTLSPPGPRIARPQSTVPSAFTAAPPTGCAPVPNGLPVVEAPVLSRDSTDNQGTELVDNSTVEIGRPEIAWTTVTGFGQLDFASPDCSVRLIDPTTVRTGTPLPGDRPAPCATGQVLGQFINDEGPADTSCTAYFLVDPQRVATAVGLVQVTDFECDLNCDTQSFYVTVTGIRDVVVVRRGPNFAASQGTEVSVDSTGKIMPQATEPTLSANGRFVGFTAPVPLGRAGQQPVVGTEVWRHDTDAAGNGSHHAGATVLVSCLPGAGCRQANSASDPSISGDGNRVAFLGAPDTTTPDQVYVRELVAGATILVSSDRHRGTAVSNGFARDPVISPDGTTVAFGSLATDLLDPPAGGRPVANLFLVDLGPGTPGITLVTPRGSAGIRPTLDAHGRLVAFESSGRLLPTAPAEVDSVYTYERFGHLVVAPGLVSYGRLIAGLPPQNRGVTVTNTGPGPVSFTGVRITGPYVLTLESCAGQVLHAGQTCQAIILFRPLTAGHPTGVLTWTTADDGEPPQPTGVDVTATVVVPAAPLLTVSPTVAYGGEVVQATGVAFPASATITLTWDKGLGVTKVTTNAAGSFRVAVVLFPDDMIGERMLQAAGPTGIQLAATPFLASAAPEEPPFHKAGR
ncbi:MAG TPA: hypothetical protein VFW65_00380 [Pseudonocardiaceae bacterium]|nr:hypothetical protein [Pseudonocardiaceae bacterium]